MIIVMFSRALKHSMLLARVKIAALNAFTQECLYGSSTIKLLNAHRDSNQRFQKLAIEYRDAQMKSVVADAVLFALLDGVSSVTIGIILWLAVSNMHDSTVLSAGIMIAFVQYVQNLFDPLKQLGNKIAMLQGAFTAIDRIFGIFDTRDFVKGEKPVKNLQGTVAFANVSFQYLPNSKTLNHVSFQLDCGQSLAIVGATGSGKSTVIKLLTKLYDGYEGSITIDGLELRDMSGQDLRRNIAIVPQDIVIFHGTVAFNIGLGDEQTDIERIKSAARFVGADRFIEHLPGAYDFVVREGGDNISQGQRQLLAFARAIAKDPRIMILDEATSSVDPASEGLIQQAIERIFTSRTLIVIAHRLSTIRKCNKILVLERGEVMEIGSHDELLAKRGRYFDLHLKMATEE
jgi:ATP-binding cassette subfamily B protein